MTTELAQYKAPAAITRFQPQTLDDIMRMASMFESSGMFPTENGRTQTAAQLAVKILAGQELGLAPFASANGMQIIKGKCTPSANIMAMKVKASGRYDYRVAEMTDNNVAVEFYERGKPVGVSTFSAEDARRAGTQNMGKFPRNMLFSRAISNGVRWYAPDLFNGVAVYTPEEMGAEVDDDGEIIIHATAERPQHRNGTQAAAPQPEPTPEPPTSLDELPEMNPEPNKPAPQNDNPFNDSPAPADALRIQAQEIIEAAGIKSPPAAQLWAVTHHYRSNEHSARNAFKSVVDEEFGGSFKQPQMAAVIRAYIARCLRDGKKEPAFEPAGPDVGDGENMPMAA